MVFEDTPAGIQAARSAGMTAVAVATIHRASELSDAEALIRTLDDARFETRDSAESGKLRLELLVENQAHESER